jgi:hypothetical protein
MTVTLPPFSTPEFARVVEAVVAALQPFWLENYHGQVIMNVGPDGDTEIVVTRHERIRGTKRTVRTK